MPFPLLHVSAEISFTAGIKRSVTRLIYQTWFWELSGPVFLAWDRGDRFSCSRHNQELETSECWCPASLMLSILSGISGWSGASHIQGEPFLSR